MHTQSNYIKDKPVFGFDIGHSSLKVMQLDLSHTKPRLVGYGSASFEEGAVADGIIAEPEVIAKTTLNLFKNRLIGDITSRRVVMAIPSYRSYSRSIQLPNLKQKELNEAVRLEVEQYTPIPIDDLYIDYTLTSKTEDANEVFAVAIPRKIVDSYLTLTSLLNLELVLIETTMAAAARLFSRDTHSDIATVIIDFGSMSSDISIFKGNVLVTGTIPAGGMVFTKSIAETLKVSESEASTIKNRYGLATSKRQKEITAALEPTLTQLAKEIRRMIRYYEDRYGNDHPIGQVIALGGGANMPGLADHLTSELRLPVRTYDPWNYIDSHNFQEPGMADHPMFATVAGLSMVNPHEVFKR
ncbi:type IV pilus assembly protein PilM [Candidatus Saccharibacteria bacterium]|nr:type IV pilus assembly protein PilM [Candidatus Saccharibacteria bacterium]